MITLKATTLNGLTKLINQFGGGQYYVAKYAPMQWTARREF